MAILHIDADAFFAAVEQGFNPLLHGKPVVVGGSENQRGVVHTASYEARAKGVRTGMSLAEAKRLCPEAVFLKGNYQHYQAVSLMMQEIYLRYTPAVEFTSLDDAYLDLTGALHLYSSVEKVASRIQQEVHKTLRIGVSIGIGKNKLIARIASGLKKPRGIVYVPPGREAEFLQTLPVDEIPGVGRVTKERLTELGIFKIGQLGNLPRTIWSELFGANGDKIWEFANGIDRREVKRRILPKQISRETTFEEDIIEPPVILATLQYLSERISAELRRHQQRCRNIKVKIRYSDFTRQQVSRSLTHASNHASEIFQQVERIVNRIPFRRLRIRQVGIEVSRIEWDNQRLDLFDEDKRSQMLDAAIDEIRQKFGFSALLPAHTLTLRNKYRMEKNGFILHSPALTR